MLLLRSSRRLLAAGQRALNTSALCLEEALPAGPKEFAEEWAKKAPSNLGVPEVPSNFTNVSTENQTQGDLFPVNFYTPSSVIADGVKKDGVTLPGIDGYFGIRANHVPIIAQLRPGVVELSSGAETEKYFVSGGFAFVHPNGVADICVLEAGTLDQYDSAAVKSALSAANSSQGQGDEYDQAANRAALELYGALDSALDSKA